MIRYILAYGSGDRKAPIISDPLIFNNASAAVRVQQELAESSYFKMIRSLSLPHDPSAGIGGDTTNEFAFQTLGIYGVHAIVSRTMTFTPSSAMDEVEIEQYREMLL